MKLLQTILIPLLLIVVSTRVALAEGDDIQIVFVHGNELFASFGLDGQLRQLTHDGIPKSLPVWSKDGSLVAYIAAVDREKALGNLVILDTTGKVLDNILFRGPSGSGGMRFIESLEWVTRHQIALNGTVNPSLTETVVVDLSTHTDQGGIFDDGPGADFSPAGDHFAYASGSPHFTPESLREPELDIDHKRVFPRAGARIRFASARRWSPDGRKVAVAVEDLARQQSIVVWSDEGAVSETPVPSSAGSIKDLFWNAGDLFVTSRSGGTLRVLPGNGVEGVAAESFTDPLSTARSERTRLLSIVESHGGREADFWCEACALSALSRKASVND